MNPTRVRVLAPTLALVLAAAGTWVSSISAGPAASTSAPAVEPGLAMVVPENGKSNPHRDDAWVLPVGEPALPEGEVGAPVRRHCALCHSFDYIATQPRLSKTAWAASVEKMRAKYGAPIPTNEVPALVAYLVKHHGKE